jgi:hypothetical protein
MVSDFAKAEAEMDAMAARVAEPARNLRRSRVSMGDLAFRCSYGSDRYGLGQRQTKGRFFAGEETAEENGRRE